MTDCISCTETRGVYSISWPNSSSISSKGKHWHITLRVDLSDSLKTEVAIHVVVKHRQTHLTINYGTQRSTYAQFSNISWLTQTPILLLDMGLLSGNEIDMKLHLFFHLMPTQALSLNLHDLISCIPDSVSSWSSPWSPSTWIRFPRKMVNHSKLSLLTMPLG